MSNAALSWAFPVPVTGPRKAVLTALAEHADEIGGCWPSIARLVLYSGVSERTVQTALKDLERANLVRIDHSSGRTSNRYWLSLNPAPDTGLISLIEAPKERKTKRVNGTNGAAGAVLPDETTPHGAHVNGAPLAPLPRSGHTNGAAGAPDPARGAPEPLKNPQQNPQLTLIEPSPGETPKAALFATGKEIWNRICGGKCPKITKATPSRVRTFHKFLHEQMGADMGQWEAYCRAISQNHFLTGNGREDGWCADFEWVQDIDHFARIIEGRYSNGITMNGKPTLLTALRALDDLRGTEPEPPPWTGETIEPDHPA